jgi:hypothetical protein
MRQQAVSFGIAGALAITMITPSVAAPGAGSALLKATPVQMTNVAWRGGGRGFGGRGFAGRGFGWRGHGGGGAGIAAGVIGGALVGAAIANSGSPGYYAPGYDDGYAPGYSGYAPGYAEPPVVYGDGAPGYYVAPPAAGSCWVWTDQERRYGYRRC